MPQHEDQPHGFEERLSAVLRGTGDTFTTDDRRELVEGGLRRGRRRLVRRRLTVSGGVLALAAVGLGGVYGGSLLGPAGTAATSSVAAPPVSNTAATATAEKRPGGPVRVDEIAAVLKAHTPRGKWTFDGLGSTGEAVGGVFDDGKGKAAVGVSLSRASGASARSMVTCPDKVVVPYDACTAQKLPNGARLMIFQGYEYPDKREETKTWRAVLLTKDGFLVDTSEYNAAAQKGAPVSRTDPPFTPAQLKILVTADAWRPLLARLPGAPGGGQDTPPPAEPSGTAVRDTLRGLIPRGLDVRTKGGGGEYGYVVVDDGKGASLVGVNVQPSSKDLIAELFSGSDVVTLPDGRKVRAVKRAGEKGGAGVVWWNVDTITPDGFRVVVSAFNSGAQHEAATRAEPALTIEQLKSLALSPKWRKVSLG
ncbi:MULTISPECIES: hypothetical protein [unclassified Streptomyces]|uniref:hypothetical protein n=1 Tax=unclassified Streptomyces TaxID=2593676 RepID=UPI003830AC82